MNDITTSLDRYQRNADLLAQEAGLDLTPRDACGVGLIASENGEPRRDVVEAGIAALKAVWHRGAVDADGKTGDGAGIFIEIPQEFFCDDLGCAPQGKLAVGMVFLPRTNFAEQDKCRTVVETEIIEFGHRVIGWRQVPVDISVIGEKANATRPEIEQIVIDRGNDIDDETFERHLYMIRRRVEKHIAAAHISDFYICSLSCQAIIYKGLFLAEDLTGFYPDLLDDRFISRFAIFHQRYSTNTWPSWKLAQPFRTLAHNGEINTLRGNVNWMRSHESRMTALVFGEFNEDLKPIVQPGSSDSSALDAVFEALIHGGRELPMVKTLLIPPAWEHDQTVPAPHRDFFEYCNIVMEPWDGPAGIAAYDGEWVIGGLDRSGLRPMRYARTSDGLLILGSETGMVPVDEDSIIEKGRVGPGQMMGVNLREGAFYTDQQLKGIFSARQPYGEWIKNVNPLETLADAHPFDPVSLPSEDLRQKQNVFGLTLEDMELILAPMVEESKEALGSMGDDTPMAVLSKRYRGMHHYFRQQFSQVTNPPIDPLREWRVMSLRTRYGNLGNIYANDEGQTRVIETESPLLFSHHVKALESYYGSKSQRIDCTFPAGGGENALQDAMDRIRQEAAAALLAGTEHLILTDEGLSAERIPVPMILAAGGVHSHLVERGLRAYCGLTVSTAETLDTHAVAVLIGVGATAVHPWLTEAAIVDRHARGLFEGLSLRECLHNYRYAMDQGLLKILSKMGISIISSYRGGYNFEAIGLSRWLVSEFFPGLISRISGIGLPGLQSQITSMHEKAYASDNPPLFVGGLYRYRRGGEKHVFEAPLIHQLQRAVSSGSMTDYRAYTDMVYGAEAVALRDLMDFRRNRVTEIPLEDVESITSIRKRFVTPGMSLGALSPEAHETLTVAMNRIGAKADSGEGGEGRERFHPRPNGDNPNSVIKQVASGRFGVTSEYLNACSEIEIKMAQGAKPGEGGQLPGFKVTAEIARLRHATRGVTLISPPPHHDIYSIEDLAQLIYDLKQINPKARVCVKLVSEAGIGTIAAGVAKAKADVILISGHCGGTGASPQTSIKYAGSPWEMGLTEANQMLTLNQLRDRVTLRTDGGIKTGRDVVMAALMGAEEYGVGTTALIATGCIMVRQCHSNTCPVGVCTQKEDLRKKYTGTPDQVVNLFSFIAEEVREILASLGLRSLDEAIGRTDLLRQLTGSESAERLGSDVLDNLDLNPLLVKVDSGNTKAFSDRVSRNEVPPTLDEQMVRDAYPLLQDGEKMQLAYSIANTHRAVGTRLSSEITRRFGMNALQPGHVTIRLRGSAGQSLGAWTCQGMRIEVVGDSNDYCGKGLSGGVISVRPTATSTLDTTTNTIIGNTCLFGATAGELYAAGCAGERFAVRNSGAHAVVEGCGDHGCEYMTGGRVVVLGNVGNNFSAGMSGGLAYVYDPDDQLASRINDDMVIMQRVLVPFYEEELQQLIASHVTNTRSVFAQRLLDEFEHEKGHFWQIVPKEMLDKLDVPVTPSDEETQQSA